jgi:glyoxylase-like metal-dependent hydrolase (beta-lactamase superfamily II)
MRRYIGDPATAVAVRAFSVPTPFAIGPVNLWLIEDDPLTLVDTGADWATGLWALESELRAAGHSPGDIKRIVITHHHPDHCGLTSVLANCTNAAVHGTAGVAEWLSRYEALVEDHDTRQLEIFVEHGLPQDVATALRQAARIARHWIAPAEVDVVIADGTVLEGEHSRWTVHHRPGHSHLDIVLHEDDGAGRLIAGDHLLGHAPPVAIMAPAFGDPNPERPRPMVDYLASLRATRELDIATVLPGHGEPFEDVRALIDRYLGRQERRSSETLDLVARGPKTAFDLAKALWGRHAMTHVTMAISETLGNLDVLAAQGQVHEVDQRGLTAFAAN